MLKERSFVSVSINGEVIGPFDPPVLPQQQQQRRQERKRNDNKSDDNNYIKVLQETVWKTATITKKTRSSLVELSINGKSIQTITSQQQQQQQQQQQPSMTTTQNKSSNNAQPSSPGCDAGSTQQQQQSCSFERKTRSRSFLPASSEPKLALDLVDGINKQRSRSNCARTYSWVSSHLLKKATAKRSTISSKEMTEQLREQELSTTGTSPRSWDPNDAKFRQQQQYSQHHQQQHHDETLASQQDWMMNSSSSGVIRHLERNEESASSLPSSSSLRSQDTYITASSRTADNHTSTNVNSQIGDECPTAPSDNLASATPLKEFTREFKSLLVDLIEYSRAKTWKKKVLTVILFILAALVFYDLFFGNHNFIVTWLHSFVIWMTTHHTASVFAFVGIFVVSTLAFVPPTLLVFGAGYAFTVAMDNVRTGVTGATISCFMGSCIGAVIAFLRARYMMRDLVTLFSNRYPLVAAIDKALKVKHGFRIMLLLRLCPIIPYNSLNYCCGITGVTLNNFTLSLVGILPFQIFIIILGATAGAVEMENLKNDYTNREKAAFIGFISTGVIFSLAAIIYAWRLVKKELKNELDLTTEEFDYVLQNGDDDELLQATIGDASVDNERIDPDGFQYQEEGEEWFWVWT